MALLNRGGSENAGAIARVVRGGTTRNRTRTVLHVKNNNWRKNCLKKLLLKFGGALVHCVRRSCEDSALQIKNHQNV